MSALERAKEKLRESTGTKIKQWQVPGEVPPKSTAEPEDK